MNTSLETGSKITAPASEGGAWWILSVGLLAVRFVQGWIYWGGGSRRFIYGPQKLNPHGHWMAYKFQTAMPGAILGTQHIISFLLHHFVLLYAGVIVFSAVELISGLMLISGFLTRLAAVLTLGLSLTLMLMFGWQGATCIDEWTMAASNFAMGVTLFLLGGGAYSVDNWIARKHPTLATKGWFQWLGGSAPLPLSDSAFKKLALTLFWIAVVFIVGTYSYYRGSVVTPFHGDPTGLKAHHIALTDGKLVGNKLVSVRMYVDAGTPTVPAHIISIHLLNKDGEVVASWSGKQLSRLEPKYIHNVYAYQKVAPDTILGLKAGLAAKAELQLPLAAPLKNPASGAPYKIVLQGINGVESTGVIVAQ